MGISIGGIDIASQGLNNELRIAVLERIIDLILQRSIGLNITQEEINQIRQEVIELLKQKYPQAGVRPTSGGSNE